MFSALLVWICWNGIDTCHFFFSVYSNRFLLLELHDRQRKTFSKCRETPYFSKASINFTFSTWNRPEVVSLPLKACRKRMCCFMSVSKLKLVVENLFSGLIASVAPEDDVFFPKCITEFNNTANWYKNLKISAIKIYIIFIKCLGMHFHMRDEWARHKLRHTVISW